MYLNGCALCAKLVRIGCSKNAHFGWLKSRAHNCVKNAHFGYCSTVDLYNLNAKTFYSALRPGAELVHKGMRFICKGWVRAQPVQSQAVFFISL